MDKQKEIEKMACDMCLVRHICTKPNEPIECCKPLKMAKKAVEAGYGDVRAAVEDVAERIKTAILCEFADNMTFKMVSRIEKVIDEVCENGH